MKKVTLTDVYRHEVEKKEKECQDMCRLLSGTKAGNYLQMFCLADGKQLTMGMIDVIALHRRNFS